MVGHKVVRKCLNRLDEYLSILRGLQRYSFEEVEALRKVFAQFL